VTKAIRVGAVVFALWMIVGGVVAVVASLSEPMPELGPIAGLMGVVLGILVLLALWAFPRSGRRSRAYGDDD
jgi:uncharacterized membrane protein HdeD (DUF308 family)